MPLTYRGAAATDVKDLVYRDYVAMLKAADLTISQIDDGINAGLAGFAAVAYVDSRDALNATKAYIDTQDNLRIKLAQKNIANGPVSLDANGKVSTSRINLAVTQNWMKGPITPAAYHAAPVDVTTTETTLYTCNIPDPGYPYKIILFGTLDGHSSLDAEYPVINVRAGSTSGEIVARGIGLADAPGTAAPTVGEQFVTSGTGLPGVDWSTTVEDGTGGGYNVSGGQATWVDVGTDDRTVRYRRLKPEDQLTQTNYQKVRLRIGSTAGEASFGDSDQWVRLAGRMNTAETSWVGLMISDGYAQLQYAAGAGAVAMNAGGGFVVSPNTPTFNVDASAATIFDLLLGTAENQRQFLVYRNNVLIASALDVNNVTSVGSGFRGWGFWGHAATRGLGVGQNTPPDIASILINDAPPTNGQISIVPNAPASMSPRTGSTTLYVRLARSGTSATVSATTYKPKLTPFLVRA